MFTRGPDVTTCPIALVAIPLLSSAVVFAQDQKTDDAKPELDRKSLKEVAPLVKGNTEFALNLYRELPKNENLFCSPFGVSEALAICYAGARGQTATQMAMTLGFPNEGKDVHEEFSLLHQVQENLEHSEFINYQMANSLWSKIPLLPAYLELAQREYGAELFKIDSPSKAFSEIAKWVAEKTRGKGESPLTLQALQDSDMKLAIFNTVYMKAPWQSQFKESATKDRAFTLLDGSEIEVPTMYQAGRFRYGRWFDLEVLELPYKGRELSAYILLPEKKEPREGPQGLGTSKERMTLEEIEADLTASDLRNSMRCAENESVKVYLPKISIKSKFAFKYDLIKMGMTDAFSMGNADFSGMTGRRDLAISAVLQNARIDLDEAGTEAVAVTVVSMVTRSAVEKDPVKWKVFRADRPFILVIRENLTGSILFMGRVVDPRVSDEDS